MSTMTVTSTLLMFLKGGEICMALQRIRTCGDEFMSFSVVERRFFVKIW